MKDNNEKCLNWLEVLKLGDAFHVDLDIVK
jgi:hypothetical protein